MTKKILACLLSVVLIAVLGVTVASAPVESADLENVKIIYYAKGGIPGPPPTDEEPPTDDPYYERLGIYLPGTASYYVNSSGAPSGALGEVQEAFETWDGITASELFTYGGTTTDSWYELDGQNTVSWVMFLPREAVAFAAMWSLDDGDPGTLDQIVEFDIVFNALHKWGIDPDDEGRTKLKRAYDVENVATHEVGHVVGLADIYDEIHDELTMYGYTKKGETKKISLELGDRLGAQSLYGAP